MYAPPNYDEVEQVLKRAKNYGELTTTIGNTTSYIETKACEHFNKPPRAGSRPTPPHQDGAYFHLRPCLAVTGWLALDEADGGNGCLVYVRGSHAGGLRAHRPSGVLGFSRALERYPQDGGGGGGETAREVRMVARPGDLLLHGALLVHFAGANRPAAAAAAAATTTTRGGAGGSRGGARQRRAIGFVYYDARARHDAAAEAAYQRRLEERLHGEGKLVITSA
eukprot:g5403.t1